MNTPTPSDLPAGESGSSTTPPTGRSWRTPLFVLLFLAVAAGSYFWRSRLLSSSAANPAGSAAVDIVVPPGDVAAEQRVVEDDPLVQQLTSVSPDLDTTTIRAELADTSTDGLDAEMDNVTAEVSGL